MIYITYMGLREQRWIFFQTSSLIPGSAFLEISEARNKLICVGRICNLKGQETLLRAVALIKSEIPGLSVDFYGNGTNAECVSNSCR